MQQEWPSAAHLQRLLRQPNDPQRKQLMPNPLDAKVTVALGLTVITIAGLYVSGLVNAIPCGPGLPATFARNFIHSNIWHLVANIWVLLSFIPLELELGASKYITLIAILLALQTGIEWIVQLLWSHWQGAESNFPICSIGLSGLLFGLLAWSALYEQKVEWPLLVGTFVVLLLPSFTNPRISWIGHLIGILSGILAVPITRMLWK